MGDWKAKAIGIPAAIWRGDSDLNRPAQIWLERTDHEDPDELLVRLDEEEAYVAFRGLRDALAWLHTGGPKEE